MNYETCPKGAGCWSQHSDQLTEPCEYGHFDCSNLFHGACSDKHTALLRHPDDPRWESDSEEVSDS